MASLDKRLNTNVAGDFYVDSTCIDCDVCRQLAPASFHDTGDYSSVYHQPDPEEEEDLFRQAAYALFSCPTASIGYEGGASLREYVCDFPLPVAENIYYCGFTSPDSFGGKSYFIQDPRGNWLVDSPRFAAPLVKRLEAMGGVDYIFLTHRDDVADAHRFAAEFGARRYIHELEADAQPDAEVKLTGFDDIRPAGFDDIRLIPTPGHTAGHMVMLYQDRYLFSGDHLWGGRESGNLSASSRYNWHSWEEQKQSLRKLLDYDFEWVLPGHGRACHLKPTVMRRALDALLIEAERVSA